MFNLHRSWVVKTVGLSSHGYQVKNSTEIGRKCFIPGKNTIKNDTKVLLCECKGINMFAAI
jgi:hypothetical protein